MSTWIAQGVDVVRTWVDLAAHGRKCPACEEAITVWRRDPGARFEPGWTVCCDEGRGLAEEWLAAKTALVARWQSERRRTLAAEREARQVVPLAPEAKP